jgi:hypothetical protein
MFGMKRKKANSLPFKVDEVDVSKYVDINQIPDYKSVTNKTVFLGLTVHSNSSKKRYTDKDLDKFCTAIKKLQRDKLVLSKLAPVMSMDLKHHGGKGERYRTMLLFYIESPLTKVNLNNHYGKTLFHDEGSTPKSW